MRPAFSDILKCAHTLGQVNTENNGREMWRSFVETLDLDDTPIGTWVKFHPMWIEIIKFADAMSPENPKWKQFYYRTQPYRIRQHEVPSLRSLAQIYFNLGSAGIRFDDFPIEEFIQL